MAGQTAAAANASTDFAVALLGEFISLGVRDLVLSPGSRSQALALAAAEYERAGLLRLRVRIDERVAGFLALGLAVETKTPVLVVTTSGTAVANLHPAVLEAHHSGVPLILLTADRPSELRGIGSNQTTEQVGLFGPAITWLKDVEAPGPDGFDHALPGSLAAEAFTAACAGPASAGPVQLNLAFREPLSGAVPALQALPEREQEANAEQPVTRLRPSAHTIVIAGHASGGAAEALARALGVPLIAEVTSGSHFGPNLVVAYRELLTDPGFGGRVERAIVFGQPTLSRQVPALLQRGDVEVVVVRGPGAEAYNPSHRATIVSGSVDIDDTAVQQADARQWLGTWVQASRMALELGAMAEGQPQADRPGDFAREQLATFREPVTREMLVELAWRSTWPHDRLVFGASRLIRVADALLPGKRIPVHANRGLAGIDGTIATSIGIALASQADTQSGGTTRVLLGDLTALHDVGALLFGAGEPRPRIQVIVANDGGGTIFDSLEVAGSAADDAFDRVLYTPQSVDLRSLAAAYGWQYKLAGNRGELDEAIAASGGTVLIEVPLPRQ
ncbi:MAG: menD [Microbacteriaceae bacterium]|nr:menD [Microbacteriaceae bacterium]